MNIKQWKYKTNKVEMHKNNERERKDWEKLKKQETSKKFCQKKKSNFKEIVTF